jgi:glycosyltransferase involved in cell wall biosynthesis
VSLGSGPSAPLRLWREVRRADLVHSHLLKADALTAVVATLAGRRARLVSGKHNDEQVLKRPLVSLVHGVLGNLPRATIVLSDHVGRFVERHGRVKRSKLRRVYYGLDPAPFERAAADAAGRAAARRELGLADGEVAFVCVARFAAQKAHDVLLRAFARALRESAVPLRLLLVGDDPFGDGRQRAEALARELALGDRALFLGIRRDVPRLLAASDAFVMASLWEGLGLVFLEAMAASLPVVATNVSAVPEVVVDGVTGRLVPAADDAALAEALRAVAADPALRRRLGAAGRERVVERFGLDRMVDETLAVYAEVAGGRLTGAPPAP